jgi:hypothetical protein
MRVDNCQPSSTTCIVSALINWDEYEALYPEGKPIVEMSYPRAKAHRQVPRAIRELLAERVTILMGEIQDIAA